MIFLKDILPIFKKYDITLKESYKELGDIYTFVFQSDKAVNWKAGQHGIFTITHKKIKKAIRPFSLASTSEEGHIKISMRIGDNPSEFKKAILELSPGMRMNMRGPIGNFYIQDNKPTLLIAGGIGITPYRAIIKDLTYSKEKKPNIMKLIYIDSNDEYIYKEEFDTLCNELDIKLSYLTKREELTKVIEKFVADNGNSGNYFVVGTKKMTDSITKFLKEQEIEKSNIKHDVFFGY